MESGPEEIRVQQPIGEEELHLIQRAESLHIHEEPRIAATQVEEIWVNLQIDPQTGHVINPTPDAAAAYCAAGPDRPDPPSECGRSPGGSGGGGGGWPGAPRPGA